MSICIAQNAVLKDEYTVDKSNAIHSDDQTVDEAIVRLADELIDSKDNEDTLKR